MSKRWMLWAGAALTVAAGLLFAGPAAAEPVALTPGTVVRWSGEDLEGCSLDGRHFEPLGGLCLFPVELRRTGNVELAVKRQGRWQTLAARVGDYPYPVQRLTIKDDSRVNLSKADLARVGKENQRIGALWHRPGARRFTLPLAAPLADLPAGGRFGSKRIINGAAKSPHSGADFAAPAGTPVLAVADGVVALAEEHFFGGNSVFIDHGDELISMYLHLSELGVQPGQDVRRGQVIGKVGSTGRSTGPHLHVGLRWRGARIAPEPLLKAPEELVSISP
jgi:murein DD-endopeptidase MepM/ murein hydrolase activator NlpD